MCLLYSFEREPHLLLRAMLCWTTALASRPEQTVCNYYTKLIVMHVQKLYVLLKSVPAKVFNLAIHL